MTWYGMGRTPAYYPAYIWEDTHVTSQMDLDSERAHDRCLHILNINEIQLPLMLSVSWDWQPLLVCYSYLVAGRHMIFITILIMVK